MYLIVFFSILILFLFLFNYKVLSGYRLTVFKVATSLGFIVIGIYSYSLQDYNLYNLYILIGLFLGFLGDFALGCKHLINKTICLVLGLCFFLFGHLFYLLAFLNEIKINIIIIISIIIVSTIVIRHINKKNFTIKPKSLTYIYLLLSIIVLVTGVANGLIYPQLNSILSLVGIVFFVLSDYILCFLYFGNPTNNLKLKLTNLALYYCGQVLLALSIYFH